MPHPTPPSAATRLRRRSLVAAVLLLPVLAVPSAAAVPDGDDPSPAEEAATGRTIWSIRPALDEDDEEATSRVSLRLEIEPGQSATDAVTVTNYGDRPATFVVYASDGIITADGQFDVLPSATEPTAAGSWVSVGDGEPGEPITVTLAAESDVTLPLVISVPTDATPGDHPAGVVASLARDAGTVGMESRVGTRIHLRVAGDLRPALAVRDLEARYEASWNPFSAGTLHLGYRLENTGNVRVGSQSTATGTGPFGVGERSGPGTEHREILPGQHAGATVVLENVWPLLRMGGAVEVIPAVVGEDVVAIPLPLAAAAWSAWTLPWPHLTALALLVAAVVVRRRTKARSESHTQARIDAAIKATREAEEDPVTSR